LGRTDRPVVPVAMLSLVNGKQLGQWNFSLSHSCGCHAAY